MLEGVYIGFFVYGPIMGMGRQMLVKIPYLQRTKILSGGRCVVPCGQKGVQTYVTTNSHSSNCFVNAPDNKELEYIRFLLVRCDV
jgi:hypothetical protein